MNKFLKRFLIYFRRYFVIIFTIVSYFCFLYYFVVPTRWLMSSVFLLLFFIFVHYFFIELKNYWLLYLILIVGISTILEIVIIWFSNIWEVLSVCFINLWIIFLVYTLDWEVNNRKIISSWSIFTSWVGIFSLFVALSYALMVVAKYPTFDLTCDTLYQGVNRLVDTLSKPLKISVEEVKMIKQKIKELKQKKVKDIVIWTGEISPLILSGTENKVPKSGILWLIENYKIKLIDSVIKDKKVVDKWVCNFMITQIKDRYNKPSFKFSVILLLTLLLWPFLRFALYIVWVINFIIFKILNFLKVYRFILKTDEVEEIV